MGNFVWTCAVFAGMSICAAAFSAQPPPSAPAAGLIIQHGQLIDGTGAEARAADVRIAGDTIVELGSSLTTKAGERAIDAAGLIVAPGFIDMHSHADRGVDQMPDAATQVRQGITTA